MSDKMRWRYGDTNPVVAAVDAETVIEIGDMLWLDRDDAKVAREFPAAGQGEQRCVYPSDFIDHFLGVAMQRSRKGDTAPIRVATTGVFEFDCSANTFELGDLIGPYVNTVAQLLKCQIVDKASSCNDAIGRVAKRQPSPATTVLVDIRSTTMTGGVISRDKAPARTASALTDFDGFVQELNALQRRFGVQLDTDDDNLTVEDCVSPWPLDSNRREEGGVYLFPAC